MSKLKKRSGSRSRFAIEDWLLLDARELSWSAVAIGGVLLFAYMAGG